MLKTLIRVLCGVAVLLLVLAAALLAWIYVEGRPARGASQYVALGSSFAAGPGITERAPDSPVFCGRSKDNYAHQLARLRGLSLVDATCSGSTTVHVLDGGQFLQPAQLDALGPNTDLVTLTIGGNDIHYMGTLIAYGCDDKTGRFWRAIGACKPKSAAQIEQKLRELPAQFDRIAAEVRRRSPRARLVFVNYQALLPPAGTCERLNVDAREADEVRAIGAALAEATRAAAQRAGADLFDAEAATRGHDVCGSEPWMTDRLARVPLHTTLEGMTAIAQGLSRLLDAPR